MKAWDTVIGLEVHAQLKTRSKLFSGAATRFGAQPNTQTCYIDAGFPGVLPVLNQEAVYMAIQFGLAINATINQSSHFERKNYFYADLPKGYQISQFQHPIVSNGFLTIELAIDQLKKIIIERAHLEEDAGKLLHDTPKGHTGVDLNRAGTPLLEIVTSPCMSSAYEAVTYLKTLHQLVRFLGICDGNMQEGSFRCDVNISLKPAGSMQLGTRTELKNLNSFRFIEKAILYEQARHQELLESGQSVQQETRLYCPASNTTQLMRSKENENDYRYFPDPDLLPVQINADDLQRIQQAMPLLPVQIKQNLQQNSAVSEEDIHFLLTSPATYQFFNEVRAQTQAEEKIVINWLKGIYAAALNDAGLSFENPPVSAKKMASLLSYLSAQTLTNKTAKQVFQRLLDAENLAIEDIIAQEGYDKVSNSSELEILIKEIIAQNPQQAADYRAGKEKLLAFFVGQIMKATKGQANPEEVNRLVKNYLAEN